MSSDPLFSGSGPVQEALSSFADEVRSRSSGSPDEAPLPTPEVLGISRREAVWQMYLAYLVNPKASHGFGDIFLNAFLEVCVEAGAFDLENLHRNRDRVNVEVEVGTEEGRRPDVLMWDSDRWFLLLELKVDAEEGEAQTEDYASAAQLGPLNVKDFREDASHYAFVAPVIPHDIDDRFQGILWRAIGEAFESARSELTLSNYPLRSVAQLDDYISTLQTTMTDVDEETRELARLYFEYRTEIETADAAVADVVEDELQHGWVSVLTDPETQPTYWDESWQFPSKGSSYGTFGRHYWSSSDEVSIWFEHRPTEDNFRAGDFEIGLAIRADAEARDGGDPREDLCQEFLRLFEQSDMELPERIEISADTADISPGHFLTKAYYSFEPGSVEGYYHSLERAANDHRELVPIIDELF